MNLFFEIIFIIYSIIISSNSNINNDDLNESIYSYITLKIEKGNNTVYSNSYSKNPKIIYINGNKQETIKREYQFTEPENFVILIWEKPITNCNRMFLSCDKIL